MSQENVGIVRKSVQGEAGDWVVVELNEVGIAESGMRVEQRFAHAVKIEDGKGIEWRMFGPVEEAFEALGLSEQKLRGAEYPFSAPRRARP